MIEPKYKGKTHIFHSLQNQLKTFTYNKKPLSKGFCFKSRRRPGYIYIYLKFWNKPCYFWRSWKHFEAERSGPCTLAGHSHLLKDYNSPWAVPLKPSKTTVQPERSMISPFLGYWSPVCSKCSHIPPPKTKLGHTSLPKKNKRKKSNTPKIIFATALNKLNKIRPFPSHRVFKRGQGGNIWGHFHLQRRVSSSSRWKKKVVRMAEETFLSVKTEKQSLLTVLCSR